MQSKTEGGYPARPLRRSDRCSRQQRSVVAAFQSMLRWPTQLLSLVGPRAVPPPTLAARKPWVDSVRYRESTMAYSNTLELQPKVESKSDREGWRVPHHSSAALLRRRYTFL